MTSTTLPAARRLRRCLLAGASAFALATPPAGAAVDDKAGVDVARTTLGAAPSASAAPEPSSCVMAGFGLAALAVMGAMRRSRIKG